MSATDLYNSWFQVMSVYYSVRYGSLQLLVPGHVSILQCPLRISATLGSRSCQYTTVSATDLYNFWFQVMLYITVSATDLYTSWFQVMSVYYGIRCGSLKLLVPGHVNIYHGVRHGSLQLLLPGQYISVSATDLCNSWFQVSLSTCLVRISTTLGSRSVYQRVCCGSLQLLVPGKYITVPATDLYNSWFH